MLYDTSFTLYVSYILSMRSISCNSQLWYRQVLKCVNKILILMVLLKVQNRLQNFDLKQPKFLPGGNNSKSRSEYFSDSKNK